MMNWIGKTLVSATLAVGGLTVATQQGVAMEYPVVVELYTSQGCSSCPPADEMVHYLAEKPGVIPLALHVDYWDYIGWKDSFARQEHTDRQRAYARVAGAKTIYTPQMVVGGVDHIVGAKGMKLAETVMMHQRSAPPVSVSLVRQGGKIQVSAPEPQAQEGKMTVQLVRYMPESTVKITRGENAGRTITYANIVTDWQVVGEWTGSEPLDLTVEAPGDEPAVIIVQKAGHGPILGAAQIK